MKKAIIFCAPVTFGQGEDATSMTEVYVTDYKGALAGGLYTTLPCNMGDIAIIDLIARDGKMRPRIIEIVAAAKSLISNRA